MSQADRPKPYDPHGAVDACVCDTDIAKKMGFIGRWGSSCGMAFDKEQFCKEHRQYENFCPYLKDRPSEEWSEFYISDNAETQEEQHKEEDKDQDKEDKEEEHKDEEEDKNNKKGGRKTIRRRLTKRGKKSIKRKY
jgi:hypothetical protein